MQQLVARMMHPKEISIKDYTYHLPEEKIARYPLEKRDDSKLLLYKNGMIREDVYKNIADHIPENSLLIFNNSKVVEARLLFQKPTGGVIEVFCLEPDEEYSDVSTAMLQKGKVVWKCLVGGASKWKRGQELIKEIKLPGHDIILRASYIKQEAGSFIIELLWQPSSLSFAEILHNTGAIPLPPYLKRNAERSDEERYQTIYASYDGSVAAPTAGLHFTNEIFEDLKTKNIQTDFVTLHVGAGTFKPVKSETMDQHEMHAEYFEVNKKTIENILKNLSGNIIPVGTTSLRTIESLYWLGIKLIVSPENFQEQLSIGQWEAYDLNKENISVKDSLQSLLQWMNDNKLDRLITKTQIIIAPGYKSKIAKALITNFHQPQSTLLLLVASLIGNNWQTVYNYALQNEFRFLSYGDGSLLWTDQD